MGKWWQPILAAAAVVGSGTVSVAIPPALPQTIPGVRFIRESAGIREYRLANGMKILLLENRVAPVATLMVVYKVGSRNEAVGYTGSTHLLEHMLFKGTPTFNKAKGTQIAATLQRIGARFNATTSLDRTNYFETVPAEQLPLAIEIEADRMRNSLIADADRQSEMTVVRNELERGQNEPAEVLDEAVSAAAYREHPYHHPTIGWRSDVENVPTSRLRQFYDTYYWPANATAIVVGDFDRDRTLALLQKHFGAYGPPPQPLPEVYTEEPPQQGERRLVIRRAGNLPLVQIAFHIPAALGQTTVLSGAALAERADQPPAQNDGYALDVLSYALGEGVTARLYQALVEGQLAVSIDAESSSRRDPGLFSITARLRPGVTPEKVEAVILAELDRVARSGLTAPELDRARRQLLAQLAYGRDGTFNIAAQLGEAEAIADWRYYRDYAENLKNVRLADVQRVAATYFTADNRTVGYFLPKETAAPAPTTGAGASRLQFYRPPGEADVLPAPDQTAQLAQAATTPARPTNFAERIARTRLNNGATLLVLENHATPSVAFRGSLLAGSYFDPADRPGLAALVAAMLERGTLRRSKLQLAEDLESVGAQLNFSGDTFALNFSGRCLSADVPRLLTALAEELREPAFPADELEKLKQQTLASLREQQSNTGYRSYQRFTTLVYPPDSPYHIPDADTLAASVRSVSVDDLRRFWKEHYGGRSLILAVAGDIQTRAVQEQFTTAFASFAGPATAPQIAAPPPPPVPKREAVPIADKANLDILLGSPATLVRSAPDFYAAVLANSALGQSTLSSRLGLVVRDREGLTYGIGSRFNSPTLTAGPWTISVSVNPTNARKAIDATLSVLRDYAANGISASELANEKSFAIGNFKVGLSTNAGLAQALWNEEFFNLGLDYLDRYPSLINAVDREAVNAAIRRYFRPDQLTIVSAGDTAAQK